MKKKLIIMTMIALSVFACRKADTGADIDTSGYTLFEVDMEDLMLEDGVSSEKVWQEGDRIGVYGSESGSNVGFWLKKSGEGKTEAEFYGPVVKGKSVRAYFPYSATLQADISSIPCELSQVQDYAPLLSVTEWFLGYCTRAFAALDGGRLHFSYPFGILRVTVALEEALMMTGAVLSSEDALAGRLAVDAEGRVRPTQVASKTITLDFGEETVPSTADGNDVQLLFVLPPAVYPAGSLVLTISVAGGDDMVLNLGEMEIRRVEGSDFEVTDIVVGTSDIPSLDIEDGYLEKEQI